MGSGDTNAAVERASEFGKDAEGVYRRWSQEIKLAEKEFIDGTGRDWFKTGDKIVARYRDEQEDARRKAQRRFNILWSNIQIQMPALYSATPKAEVRRRFKDRDRVGRLAAEALERRLQINIEEEDFDDSVELALLDYLLAARGVLWIMYEVDKGRERIREYLDEAAGEDGMPPPTPDGDSDATFDSDRRRWYRESEQEVVAERRCYARFIQRKDFLHNPARTWREVRWVAKREYLTRDECVRLFGKDIGNEIKLTHEPRGVDARKARATPEYEAFLKAVVWEVWDKTDRRVLWISEGYPKGPCKTAEDPLRLKRFFPVPRPLYGTLTPESLVPVPDYVEYQSQAEEIDDLTRRIHVLTKALKVAGVYAGVEGVNLKRLIEEGDNVLIPVDGWAMFAERGGLPGMISWLPIDQVAKVLVSLFEAREKNKNDLYEVMGISDLLRGVSMATETATAQRIKGQYGALRLNKRQRHVQRFVRDAIAIQGEIIAEHYAPEDLASALGVDMMANPQVREVFEQALELLRSDRMRTFRLDIETDSTLEADEQMEKQQRTEFVAAAAQFLQQAAVVGQSMPSMVPLLNQMMMFAVRGFKTGRQLEDAFEEAGDAAQQEAAMARERAGQPDPEVVLKGREVEIEEGRLRLDQDKQAWVKESFQRKLDQQADDRQAERDTKGGIKILEIADAQRARREERDAQARAEGRVTEGDEEMLAAEMHRMIQAMGQQQATQSAAAGEAIAALAQAAQMMAQAAAVMAQPRQTVLQHDERGRPVGSLTTVVGR